MWGRRRHRDPDPDKLGDLTMWEGVDEDGEEFITWAEMTPDPKMADAVERVKDVMRDQGWTQTVRD